MSLFSVARLRSTGLIKLVEPHLTFSDDNLKEGYLVDLHTMLIEQPDSVFVVGGFRGSELVAFGIAYNPGSKSPHVLLTQAWSEHTNQKELVDNMFSRIILWAMALEKSGIRAETQRSTEALFRAYGFEKVTEVVQLTFNKEIQNEMLQEVSSWVVHSNQTLTQTVS